MCILFSFFHTYIHTWTRTIFSAHTSMYTGNKKRTTYRSLRTHARMGISFVHTVIAVDCGYLSNYSLYDFQTTFIYEIISVFLLNQIECLIPSVGSTYAKSVNSSLFVCFFFNHFHSYFEMHIIWFFPPRRFVSIKFSFNSANDL